MNNQLSFLHSASLVETLVKFSNQDETEYVATYLQ